MVHVAGDVAAVDDAELVVVAGELQGLVHLLVEQEPVAGRVLHVARPGGEEGADRLRLELADHRGELVAAAERHPAPAGRIHPAERLGPVPRGGERRDAAAAAAGDAAVVAVGGEVELILLRHEREQLLGEEPDVVVAHAVVFEAAIAAIQRPLHRRGERAGPDEDPDGHGDLLRGDHELHHRLLSRVEPVRLHVDARRLLAVILRGDEDRHVAHRAGEDPALGETELLRHAGPDVLGRDRRRLVPGALPAATASFTGLPASGRMNHCRCGSFGLVGPQVDLRAGVGLAADIVQPHRGRMLRREGVAAVLVPGHRPALPGLAAVGLEHDPGAVLRPASGRGEDQRRAGATA